jgi:copper chaperone CopZ
MNKYSLKLSNLKCGGCVNSVKENLSKLEHVHILDVNLETKILEVEAEADTIEIVINKLSEIGYPVVK